MNSYRQAIEAWRAGMEAQMRAPGPWGWIAIVGMYPLRIGSNTIGSDPQCDVILPAGAAPELLGTVEFDGQHGTLRVSTAEVVTVDGEATRHAKLRNHYEPGGMSVVRVREVSFGVMQWASDPYNIRVWDANSPKRLAFPGRAWYPIDPAWRVRGAFTRLAESQSVTVEHTGGLTQELKLIGQVAFTLQGQDFRFEAMASELGPEYVWLLARDTTNGTTTYGGGRFLHMPLLAPDQVDVDFNRIYQPPCAFCEYTTCPMPPKGNRLPFPVEAGEKYPT
ncbi:MAG: DUF1684 domain-containing protein [Anaerolineae bacterium]|nr:DUF1684 domain-containing protein [Anaerolineae bacterium]